MLNKFNTSATLLALTISSTSFAGSHASCGEVTVGSMGWASGESLASIAAFVLEQGYGCKTTLVPTDTVPAVTSLAENMQPDVVPEIWVNSSKAYTELVEKGQVITASNVFADGAEEGWWIPTYLAEAHPELKTIEGILENPELVGGRFHNCPVGWGCRTTNANLAAVHGMEEKGIEMFEHGSGANLAASIASAHEEKGPWFGYYWGPTAVLGKYPMTRVVIGPNDIEQYTLNTIENQDPAKLAPADYPAAPVVNAMTPAFAQRAPEAADFVRNFSLPNSVISGFLNWRESNNASADETAAYVLTTHKDLIMSMVSDDARAKLEALF